MKRTITLKFDIGDSGDTSVGIRPEDNSVTVTLTVPEMVNPEEYPEEMKEWKEELARRLLHILCDAYKDEFPLVGRVFEKQDSGIQYKLEEIANRVLTE